jgi:G3E family GTPase
MQVAETFTFDLAGLDPSISEGANLLKELSVLDTCVTVVDCSSFQSYFESKDIASERFTDVDEADDRSIFQLLCDQIEFSNVILLNKCDLVPPHVIAEIKHTIKLLN